MLANTCLFTIRHILAARRRARIRKQALALAPSIVGGDNGAPEGGNIHDLMQHRRAPDHRSALAGGDSEVRGLAAQTGHDAANGGADVLHAPMQANRKR